MIIIITLQLLLLLLLVTQISRISNCKKWQIAETRMILDGACLCIKDAA